MFRIQVAVIGTLAVFAGTWFATFSILSLLTFGSVLLGWIAQLIGVLTGIALALRVRKEVKTRPEYVSNSPFGWWP
jgi:membrane associated rhomboid family serine protease